MAGAHLSKAEEMVDGGMGKQENSESCSNKYLAI